MAHITGQQLQKFLAIYSIFVGTREILILSWNIILSGCNVKHIFSLVIIILFMYTFIYVSSVKMVNKEATQYSENTVVFYISYC
jgi:hypothetical protein